MKFLISCATRTVLPVSSIFLMCHVTIVVVFLGCRGRESALLLRVRLALIFSSKSVKKAIQFLAISRPYFQALLRVLSSRLWTSSTDLPTFPRFERSVGVLATNSIVSLRHRPSWWRLFLSHIVSSERYPKTKWDPDDPVDGDMHRSCMHCTRSPLAKCPNKPIALQLELKISQIRLDTERWRDVTQYSHYRRKFEEGKLDTVWLNVMDREALKQLENTVWTLWLNLSQ